MSIELDHLVVAAASLDEGVRWCEARLGVTPAAGGRHALMGTHNRLVNLSSPAFPRAYLEIIAIDPEVPAPGRVRWFGLDDPLRQAALREAGPRLIHWVARSPTLEAHRAGLTGLGLDPGTGIVAHRDTPAGRLGWRILVRDDGRLHAGGALPTLIAWDDGHPADHLPAQGLALRALQIDGLPAAAGGLLQPRGVNSNPDAAPAIHATLDSPRGALRIDG